MVEPPRPATIRFSPDLGLGCSPLLPENTSNNHSPGGVFTFARFVSLLRCVSPELTPIGTEDLPSGHAPLVSLRPFRRDLGAVPLAAYQEGVHHAYVPCSRCRGRSGSEPVDRFRGRIEVRPGEEGWRPV